MSVTLPGGPTGPDPDQRGNVVPEPGPETVSGPAPAASILDPANAAQLTRAVHLSAAGFHKHQCWFCMAVWEHHDRNDSDHGTGGAHECPACGRCNWGLGIYVGGLPPMYRNGDLPPVGIMNAPGPTPDYPIHPDQARRYG